MSVVAIVCGNEHTICLSDGMQIYLDEDMDPSSELTLDDVNVHSREAPKIHKINSRICLLWVGWIPECREELLDDLRSASLEPADVAQRVQEFLRQRLSEAELANKLLNINIHVVGYSNNGELEGHQMATSSAKPLKITSAQLGHGDVHSMIPFADNTGDLFSELLINKYLPMMFNSPHAAIDAFKEMVKTYNNQGLAVGGKMFYEFISAPGLENLELTGVDRPVAEKVEILQRRQALEDNLTTN